jgi:hypothetical protein
MGLLPWGQPKEARANYHFTADDRQNALEAEWESSGDLSKLGAFLHAQQNSYSHRGYGPAWGQIPSFSQYLNWYATDYTSTNPQKANSMAEETYSYLTQAAGRTLGSPSVIPWKSLASLVDKYNRAKPKSADKTRYYSEILKLIENKRREEKRSSDVRTLVCAAEFQTCQ